MAGADVVQNGHDHCYVYHALLQNQWPANRGMVLLWYRQIPPRPLMHQITESLLLSQNPSQVSHYLVGSSTLSGLIASPSTSVISVSSVFLGSAAFFVSSSVFFLASASARFVAAAS